MLPDGDATYYRIRLRGRVDLPWAEWFEGARVEPDPSDDPSDDPSGDPSGDTVVLLRIEDQAALHGVFKVLRDLGLCLVSANPARGAEGGRLMKAIVFDRYGPPDGLRLEEVEKPVPGEGEVLVRMRASSVNSRDQRMLRADPFFIRFMVGGLFRPKVRTLGVDAAGVVEAVGAKVDAFEPGDEVFGLLHGRDGGGGRCFAEYALARADELVMKPPAVGFEAAAAAPCAALTALVALRDYGKVGPGSSVLVQGASGGVGHFAVQIAKALGARVTAVCSARAAAQAAELGAARVLDYRREDFVGDAARGGLRYDVALAVNGYRPLRDYLRVLAPGGRLVVAGGALRLIVQAGFRGKGARGGKTASVAALRSKREDLAIIKDMLESGKISPRIDAVYSLERAAEAFRHFEDRHALGKLAIAIGAAGAGA